MRRLLALLALTVTVATCGSDDEGGGEATADRPRTQTTETIPDNRKPVANDDERAIRKLADAYFAAYAKADWTGVCATLSPAARRRLDRKAGRCEEVFETTSTAKARKAVRNVKPNDVLLKGDRATVTMEDSKTYIELPVKVYAAKVDGRWWLVIKRAAKGAP